MFIHIYFLKSKKVLLAKIVKTFVTFYLIYLNKRQEQFRNKS